MSKNHTEIYHLIDNSFISGFSESHIEYMKSYYYSFYSNYCISKNKSPLCKEKFFTNMRRHKVKLVQICCPYCGNMNIWILEGTISLGDSLNYCTSCGKKSASDNAFFQISRLIRIRHFHQSGLEKLKESSSEKDLKLLSYDIYQLELIEITSIIEVSLREFFVCLVYLTFQNTKNKYFDSIIKKSTGNDFMNIGKANNHYKKALDIDLRNLISCDCWNNLLDIVEIRNTIVHNNGMIDKKFRNTQTYTKIASMIEGNLIFLTPQIIQSYFNDVLELITSVTKYYNSLYENTLHSLIANFYFNSHPLNSDNCTWASLEDLIPKH